MKLKAVLSFSHPPFLPPSLPPSVLLSRLDCRAKFAKKKKSDPPSLYRKGV